MLATIVDAIWYYVKYILPFHFILSLMLGLVLGKHLGTRDENVKKEMEYHYEEWKRSSEEIFEYKVDANNGFIPTTVPS